MSETLGPHAHIPPALIVRRLVIEGFRSLFAGCPNMNSLVAVGCTTSFTVRVSGAENDAQLKIYYSSFSLSLSLS